MKHSIKLLENELIRESFALNGFQRMAEELPRPSNFNQKKIRYCQQKIQDYSNALKALKTEE